MELSFKKGHLLAKKGTSPDAATHPKVKVILCGFGDLF
jgi:hypothetical protein